VDKIALEDLPKASIASIVDDADAMSRQYSQNLTVALAL
jgi:hypothetical protein